jgi:benzylsuccinate CoA-transferase BbsF subunit
MRVGGGQPPLAGVRIIDFTIVVAGPVGTSLLGELGAEVIKIEHTRDRPSAPEDAWGSTNHWSSFQDRNRNKLGLALNMETQEARDIVRRLVAVSDVVIENFSPRVMPNWGLQYEELTKINPGIISVSMPAFGRTGPRRNMTSYGPGIDAMSGLSHLTGYPDSTPLKPGNYYCDYNAGVHAALAVMAGIYHRRKTGEGQAIEVAMRDGETQLVGEYVLDYALNGRINQRMANRHPMIAPHSIYRCSGEDSWIAITATNDAEWTALCEAIGRPTLATAPEFATAVARKQNEARLDVEIAAWTVTQDHIEAMNLLQRAGVPAGAVLSTGEIARDPQFLYREAFHTITRADGRSIRVSRAGWLAHNSSIITGRGPEQSEHTETVLRDLLGMTEAEIATAVEAGATVLPVGRAAT